MGTASDISLTGRRASGAVHLQVSDLQRSLLYYEQVLGLRGTQRHRLFCGSRRPWRRTPLGNAAHETWCTRARRGAFGLYHFAILLPERNVLGRFAAHLGALDVRVAMADHLVSEALYLWDPDGLGIEVYAD